ncbi:hypothetical protein [Roseobacter weihaiensis]|uniref:hypothetical protein n=1 Tax=Roseobacter weihaiensis TaxID=2763262 RepID=UPI001D09F8CA|nr:hypothetical protein [Roseobacter sp. H9]
MPRFPAEIAAGGFTGARYAGTVQRWRLLNANGPDYAADTAFEGQICRIVKVFGGLTDLFQSARDANIDLL